MSYTSPLKMLHIYLLGEYEYFGRRLSSFNCEYGTHTLAEVLVYQRFYEILLSIKLFYNNLDIYLFSSFVRSLEYCI